MNTSVTIGNLNVTFKMEKSGGPTQNQTEHQHLTLPWHSNNKIGMV